MKHLQKHEFVFVGVCDTVSFYRLILIVPKGIVLIFVLCSDLRDSSSNNIGSNQPKTISVEMYIYRIVLVGIHMMYYCKVYILCTHCHMIPRITCTSFVTHNWYGDEWAKYLPGLWMRTSLIIFSSIYCDSLWKHKAFCMQF